MSLGKLPLTVSLCALTLFSTPTTAGPTALTMAGMSALWPCPTVTGLPPSLGGVGAEVACEEAETLTSCAVSAGNVALRVAAEELLSDLLSFWKGTNFITRAPVINAANSNVATIQPLPLLRFFSIFSYLS